MSFKLFIKTYRKKMHFISWPIYARTCVYTIIYAHVPMHAHTQASFYEKCIFEICHALWFFCFILFCSISFLKNCCNLPNWFQDPQIGHRPQSEKHWSITPYSSTLSQVFARDIPTALNSSSRDLYRNGSFFSFKFLLKCHYFKEACVFHLMQRFSTLWTRIHLFVNLFILCPLPTSP